MKSFIYFAILVGCCVLVYFTIWVGCCVLESSYPERRYMVISKDKDTSYVNAQYFVGLNDGSIYFYPNKANIKDVVKITTIEE